MTLLKILLRVCSPSKKKCVGTPHIGFDENNMFAVNNMFMSACVCVFIMSYHAHCYKYSVVCH